MKSTARYPMPAQSILEPEESQVRVRLWATSDTTVAWFTAVAIVLGHVVLGAIVAFAF